MPGADEARVKDAAAVVTGNDGTLLATASCGAASFWCPICNNPNTEIADMDAANANPTALLARCRCSACEMRGVGRR